MSNLFCIPLIQTLKENAFSKILHFFKKIVVVISDLGSLKTFHLVNCYVGKGNLSSGSEWVLLKQKNIIALKEKELL